MLEVKATKETVSHKQMPSSIEEITLNYKTLICELHMLRFDLSGWSLNILLKSLLKSASFQLHFKVYQRQLQNNRFLPFFK